MDGLVVVLVMRAVPNVRLEQIRIDGPRGANCGAFKDGSLRIIVSDGGGWDHVSVSRPDRTPTWEEMDRVKRLCFRDDEVVMQLHVNDGRKVNVHDHCLHLWRPQTTEEMLDVRAQWESAGEPWPYGQPISPGAVPMPPEEMV